MGAAGSGLTYQWLLNGTAIAGATGATYPVASVAASNAGNYSVIVTNEGGSVTSVAAVVAVQPPARLINLSSRAFTGSGNNVLVVGFAVGGSGSKSLLLRGVGPTLANYGVSGWLAQPELTLFQGSQSFPTKD